MMKEYDATEMAYKNGYAAGLKAAEKDKTKLSPKNRKLIHKNAKLARLERAARQENEELRDQVYNLTLYLHRAIITGNRLVRDSTFGDVLEEGYDGMPGYNPEILEVRNGAND